MSIHTALIPQSIVERLIDVAWAARVHINTGDGAQDAQLRDELREACNAARGALVALEVNATMVYGERPFTEIAKADPELPCQLRAICQQLGK